MRSRERQHRGTLVCVVLKAKNLPNKRSIGKQDPYAELCLGSDTQQTKPDKRGGQHPTWDEQLHFEIYDEVQHAFGPERGRDEEKTLSIVCYAAGNDPEPLGEGYVSLNQALRDGEFDDWVPLASKGKYSGEVYVELTYYSLVRAARMRRTDHAAGAADELPDQYSVAGRRCAGPEHASINFTCAHNVIVSRRCAAGAATERDEAELECVQSAVRYASTPLAA